MDVDQAEMGDTIRKQKSFVKKLTDSIIEEDPSRIVWGDEESSGPEYDGSFIRANPEELAMEENQENPEEERE